MAGRRTPYIDAEQEALRAARVEDARQRSFADEQREKEIAERARQFAEQHGLKTAKDHIEFLRRKMRSFGTRDPFETWCSSLTQKAVDRIFMLGGRDAERMRRRWLEAGVIDEHDKLVPLDEREGVRLLRQAEAERHQAEVDRRRKEMLARAAELAEQEARA